MLPPDNILPFIHEPVIDCHCGASLEGAATVRKHSLGGEIFFRNCTACGSWTQSPRLSAGNLQNLIDSTRYFGTAEHPGLAYGNYVADEDARRFESQFRLHRDLAPIMRRSDVHVLEVGCASASLLAACRDHGWSVQGIDLSQEMVDAARAMNQIDVLKGDPLEMDFPSHSFDLIMLFGTFGNLREPGRYLALFRQWLKPDGHLVFNFVDASAFFTRYVYGERCWMFTPSVNFFATTKAIRRLLEQNGFENPVIRQDWQQPSFDKLLRHARLSWLADRRMFRRFASLPVPVPLPLPSLRFVSCHLGNGKQL